MTKQDLTLKHLHKNNTITNFEAIGLYHNYRLSATIHRLRNKGWNIQTRLGFNAFNDSEYAIYFLASKDNELV